MTKQSRPVEAPELDPSVLNHTSSEALALERAKEYALPKTIKKRGGISVISFRIGSEWLGMASDLVKQVMSPREIRSIPHRTGPHRTGNIIKGIANYKGEILVVVSLRDLLGIDPSDEKEQNKTTPSHTYPRTMLIGREGRAIAIPVDELYGKVQYQRDGLHEAPATLRKAMRCYALGIIEMGGRQIGILDGELLLYTIEQHLK